MAPMTPLRLLPVPCCVTINIVLMSHSNAENDDYRLLAIVDVHNVLQPYNLSEIYFSYINILIHLDWNWRFAFINTALCAAYAHLGETRFTLPHYQVLQKQLNSLQGFPPS